MAKEIASKRKWLKCGLEGFFDAIVKISVKRGKAKAMYGITASWSVEKLRMMAKIN